MGIAHLTFDLGAGNQSCDRVNDQNVDGVAADEGIDDIECIFAAVRLDRKSVV